MFWWKDFNLVSSSSVAQKPVRYRRAISYDSKEYYMRLLSGNPGMYQHSIHQSTEGESTQQEPEHGEDTIAKVKGKSSPVQSSQDLQCWKIWFQCTNNFGNIKKKYKTFQLFVLGACLRLVTGTNWLTDYGHVLFSSCPMKSGPNILCDWSGCQYNANIPVHINQPDKEQLPQNTSEIPINIHHTSF